MLTRLDLRRDILSAALVGQNVAWVKSREFGIRFNRLELSVCHAIVVLSESRLCVCVRGKAIRSGTSGAR